MSLKNAVFARRDAGIHSASDEGPPIAPDLNPVYKTCMTDLDDLKHRIKTEWAKLDHAVISAAVHRDGVVVSQCANPT